MGERTKLTGEMREGLERIVIQLLELAARRPEDPSLQHELMRLADQISTLLDK